MARAAASGAKSSTSNRSSASAAPSPKTLTTSASSPPAKLQPPRSRRCDPTSPTLPLLLVEADAGRRGVRVAEFGDARNALVPGAACGRVGVADLEAVARGPLPQIGAERL